MKLITCFLFVVIFTDIVSGQGKLPPVNRAPEREFDILNIDLCLRFDIAKKEVFGTAVEKIVPLRDGYDTVHLDAIGMNIEKAEMNGRPLGY